MKTMVTRFIVSGLIMVAIGLGVFYYFTAPEPALNTYYQLSELLTNEDYQAFDANISSINIKYPLGTATNADYKILQEALDFNLNYYNTYLLFVKNVSASDQKEMNYKIQDYENSFVETNRLLIYFNSNASDNQTINAGMHNNFINAYKVQIQNYIALIENLKAFVIKYAFDGATPVGLKQTLLKVQLDYVTNIVDNNFNFTYMLSELNSIKNKYALYENNPHGSSNFANNFVYAYANFESISDYILSDNKPNFIASYEPESQKLHAQAIYDFLNSSSYN